jgi:hypothetical protein
VNERLASDIGSSDEIIESMEINRNLANTLAVEVEEQGWRRKTQPFELVTPQDVADFPQLDDTALKILFTGSYQFKQAISYLAEIMDDDGNVHIRRVKDQSTILKFLVQSRHKNAKEYKCFVEYLPHTNVTRYCCDCANGMRTVGCCAHVAAIIFYLSNGRYQSRIVRPAQILSKLFREDDTEVVIEEDSDDDD